MWREGQKETCPWAVITALTPEHPFPRAGPGSGNRDLRDFLVCRSWESIWGKKVGLEPGHRRGSDDLRPGPRRNQMWKECLWGGVSGTPGELGFRYGFWSQWFKGRYGVMMGVGV